MASTDTQFTPGQSGNPSGRPKGALNRTTQEMREVMAHIHNRFLGQLEADLQAMSPKNRWDILCKLAPFHMPSLSKNDNTNTSNGQVTIKVEYADQIPPVLASQATPELTGGSTLKPLGILDTPFTEVIDNQDS
ncbi:MAG: hypothetical protein EOO97_00110 [Pedobacter sp.]|nr:MAG: hypothetical protein EOO97_00110 [Pedobacter sp.]